MSLALWLIILPLGAVPLVYLLRRTKLGGIAAVVISLCLAWLTLRLPTGLVLNLLGRPIALERLSQITLALMFGATGLLFLIPLLAPDRIVHGGLKQGIERTFYPVGLATLACFVAASLSRHLGMTALSIEAAAILTVFIIQGQRLDSIRAGLRFLVMMSLATPLFLLAAWHIDIYQLSGGLLSAINLKQTIIFISFGFAVWLAVVPFHSWLTTTAAESSPATAAFVLIVFPLVAFSTLIQLLADFPWLVNSPELVRVIIIAGVFTAFVGGLLAAVQRGFAELMGYTTLYNLGCILAVLGLGGEAAVITILVALTVRALALTLLAVSASTLRLHSTSDGFALVTGMARRMPVACVGLLIGGLTLAGAPLTAGFAPQWQLLRSIAALNSGWAVLLVLAGFGVAIGYLRGFRATLLSGPDSKPQTGRMAAFSPQEPRLLLIMIGLLAIVSLWLGLFPSQLIEPLQRFGLKIVLAIR